MPSCFWSICSRDPFVDINKERETLSPLWNLMPLQLNTIKINSQSDLELPLLTRWTFLWIVGHWYVTLVIIFWTIACSLRRACCGNDQQCSRFPWGFLEARNLLSDVVTPEKCCDIWASALWKYSGVSLKSSSFVNEGVDPPLLIITGMYLVISCSVWTWKSWCRALKRSFRNFSDYQWLTFL